MIPVSVHYVPVVLRSASEICRAFGISREQLQKWGTEGVPVVVEQAVKLYRDLGKQLLDAMTRAGFWHDDRQVVSLRCSKRYAAVPGWEVAVYSLGGQV